MFRRMMVPLDGSPEGESIPDPVLETGEPFGSSVLLLRVVEEPLPFGLAFLLEGPWESNELLRTGAAEARACLSDVEARPRPGGVAATPEVGVGGQAARTSWWRPSGEGVRRFCAGRFR